MKFLINYNTFTDISSILWALQNLQLSRFDNHFILKNDIDEFTFVTSNSEYHPWGTPIFEIENNYDKKIIASHKLIDYDKSKFDYMIYSNLDEPFHDIESENSLEFLNDGNIILSATYTNKIIHKNLISDYRFNLYYFYHDKGFNFLNFYNFKEKDSLFGIYEREASNRHSTPQHSMLYNLVKDVVGNELIDFSYIEYPLKNLISHQPRESYVSFGMWKQNYISSYIDMSRCVVFYMRESPVNPYITEKTLKSILFSKANIISIWCGRDEEYQFLKEYGFWFLNSEFYTNNISESVILATNYCLELKQNLITNDKVFDFLIEKYGDKLKKNGEILDDILFNCPIKKEIITCISKK